MKIKSQEDLRKKLGGDIDNWHREEIRGCHYGLGYVIVGHEIGAPSHSFTRTSPVLTHDEATGEIETYNSHYRLIGKEMP